MNKIRELATLAGREAPPPSVNVRGVMERIMELSPDVDEGEYVPIRLFAGVGALAAVAAAVVLVFAAGPVLDLYNPGIDQLFDVMDAIL